ncbi:MAG: KH domain-containing protein [Clostridia bacterium]|nr:KH domain-containing protein [Clostridia bacterium]
MLELVKYIVFAFAEKKDEIEFTQEETDDLVTITVTLNESDMGKVIGRQGKIAKAMRTIVKSASAKSGKKYNIEIKEKGEIA